MAELFRYAAFISYSSADAKFAQRLHRALESYGVPTSLGQFDLIGGGKKNRIYPVFRDREELSAGDLSDRIEAALKASGALIVVCSPNAAASPWVQKEIESFIALGRRDRIFAIIPDTAPATDESGADATPHCFPPAFRGDDLADANALEPLAADARKGKDGFRSAWLKLVAGLIGVTPGQLIDRDRTRRGRRRVLIGACVAATALSTSLGGAAIDAYTWRRDLSALAASISSEGRVLDAASLALAGMPASGDVLRVANGEPADAVRASGLVYEIVNLGDAEIAEFSPGDRYLLTRVRGSETASLYNLASPHEKPAPMGAINYTEFSPSGRYLIGTLEARRVLFDLQASLSEPLTSVESEEYTPYWHFVLSHDERFLVARTLSTDAVLRNLSAPERAELPLGRIISAEFSNDGRYLLTVAPPASRTLYAAHSAGELLRASLYDLLSASPAPVAIGRVAPLGLRAGFSPDSEFLVLNTGVGAFLHDLSDQRHQPLNLGDASEAQFGFSGDSQYVWTRGRDRQFTLRRLRDPLSDVLTLDDIAESGFSADGRFLVVVTNDSRDARLYDLTDGSGQPIALGALLLAEYGVPGGAFSSALFQFSNDGRRLFLRGQGGATLRDLRRASEPGLPLGEVISGSGFSEDGRYLFITRTEQLASLYDLNAPEAEPRSLGRVRFQGARFSAGSRFLLTLNMENRAAILNLEDEQAEPLNLGRINGDCCFSPDGKFLLTTEWHNNQTTLRLLDHTVPLSGALTIRAQTCRLNGDSLRPFARALRSGAEEVARHLSGRPWNPCDWRGFLAILPSEQHGDGWFEGARQWLRLMHVRYFDGRDWACEETTSRASEATRRARAEMCERFADHESEAEAPAETGED
jgi:WD40 repeat protein